jgi:hypothetical protein
VLINGSKVLVGSDWDLMLGGVGIARLVTSCGRGCIGDVGEELEVGESSAM